MTREPAEAPACSGMLRIDKWLWFARLAKSRSLAARLCAAGAVTVGARPVQRASHAVRCGDILTVPQGRLMHTVRVVALGVRRGPASEARGLYEPLAPPRPIAASEPQWEPLFAEDEVPDMVEDRAPSLMARKLARHG
jgi:ribosome-associated heat shock protein Hsp15